MRRGGRPRADVVGIEIRTVMLGGPQASGGLVSEGDGRLVVADAFGQGQRPGAEAVERLLFLLRQLGTAQHGAGAVDEQHAQVDVAAFGHATETSDMAAGVFARGEAQRTGEVAAGLTCEKTVRQLWLSGARMTPCSPWRARSLSHERCPILRLTC